MGGKPHIKADVGFDVGILVWPLLKSFYRIRVFLAYQKY